MLLPVSSIELRAFLRKPSAKRSERELEAYKRELAAKKKANADTPLGSMQMLKAATKVRWTCACQVGLLSCCVFVSFAFVPCDLRPHVT